MKQILGINNVNEPSNDYVQQMRDQGVHLRCDTYVAIIDDQPDCVRIVMTGAGHVATAASCNSEMLLKDLVEDTYRRLCLKAGMKAEHYAPPLEPEPAPKHGGELVTPQVYRWLHEHHQQGRITDGEHEIASALVAERNAFGCNKYGAGLSWGDGRHTFKDITDELGDALQYMTKLKREGAHPRERAHIRALLNVLGAMVNDL